MSQMPEHDDEPAPVTPRTLPWRAQGLSPEERFLVAMDWVATRFTAGEALTSGFDARLERIEDQVAKTHALSTYTAVRVARLDREREVDRDDLDRLEDQMSGHGHRGKNGSADHG